MEADLTGRELRGKKLFDEGAVHIEEPDALFEVHGYSVVKDGEMMTCNCPDHTYRGVECKHIFAVFFASLS